MNIAPDITNLRENGNIKDENSFEGEDDNESSITNNNLSSHLIHNDEKISRGTGKQQEKESELRRDGGQVSKIKAKKKKFLTICTANCKYDVIRRVAAQYGMKEVTEDSTWNLYWTDLSVSIERAKDMKRFQKVNHFPGMTEICRKDLLARNLNRMQRLFPKEYNFFPKTWCLPTDYGDVVTYGRTRRSKTFIIKPDTGCQGRGIYLTKSLKEIKPYDRMICQVYLTKPLLIDGYKFDMRVYTLITSCDPLRIYVYNDGLARFATSRYKEPTGHNTSNVFMHLTNYAVNKHSKMYVTDENSGSKRKISTLNKWLKSNGIDVDELWQKIDEIIVKTVLAAHPILKHSYHTCFSTHDHTYACFEILGFDILIDWKLKPFLLEVNHSPSFHTDAQIDKDVKESLLLDTFKMLNLHQYDKRKIIEEDKKRVRDRLLQGIATKEFSVNDTASSMRLEEESFLEQYKWEDENMGNFRRVYPSQDYEKYERFFKQNNTSMFQDTAASRAREEASKNQREEAIMKMKMEESKRMLGKWDSKLDRDTTNGLKRMNSASVGNKSKTSISKKCLAPLVKKSRIHTPPIDILSSFVPEIISEEEEKDRIASLAQRDFLIRSHGILKQIYLLMKRSGTLRPADVKKYGIFGKSSRKNELCPNISYQKRSQQIESNINSEILGERDFSNQYKNFSRLDTNV